MKEERLYTYKFRLYPDVKQRVYLAQVFRCCRNVYNHFLDIKPKQYEDTKTSDSYAVQQSGLTMLRNDEFSYKVVLTKPITRQGYKCRNEHFEICIDKECRLQS